MRKLMTFLGAMIIISLLMPSCISTKKGYQSSTVISRNVELDPIKADIKVDENSKLTGESSSAYFLFFQVNGDNTFTDGINFTTRLARSSRINKARGAAAYKALSSGDYDVLVNPNYSYTIENYLFYKKYTVKVNGFGGKYINYRTEKQKIVILEDGKHIILQDN